MHSDPLERLEENVARVIVGKKETIRLSIVALLSRGHLLIEDMPGLGKTALARALAKSISADFRRVQFTPDLVPSDITGVSIFDPDRRAFAFKTGPIFTHILLADEINRASPRTQSALLEAMNESQVTVDGETHRLPDPFLVLATQNPLEVAGTYPLPESQVDRFMMVLRMGYPRPDEEKAMLAARRVSDPLSNLEPVLTLDEVRQLCQRTQEVRVEPPIHEYILRLVQRTREERAFLAGVSPRGSLHLARAAQAHSLLVGRDYATPDDVKAVAPHVLTHRLTERRLKLHPDGRLSALPLVMRILEDTPVP